MTTEHAPMERPEPGVICSLGARNPLLRSLEAPATLTPPFKQLVPDVRSMCNLEEVRDVQDGFSIAS